MVKSLSSKNPWVEAGHRFLRRIRPPNTDYASRAKSRSMKTAHTAHPDNWRTTHLRLLSITHTHYSPADSARHTTLQLQLQLQSLNLTFQDDKAHNATLLATALQQYADTTTCNLDLLPLCDPKTGADRIVNYHLHTLAYDLEPLEQIAVLLQLIGSSVLAEPFQLSLQTDIINCLSIPRARPVRVSPHSQLTPLLMILNAPFAATVDGFVTPHLLAAAETLARPATVWAVAVDNRGCQAWIFCTTVTPAKLRQIQVSAAKVLYGGGGFKVSGPATGTLLEVERVGPYEIRSRDGRRNFGAVLWEILRKVASDWIELH